MQVKQLTGANALTQGDSIVLEMNVDKADGTNKDLTGGFVQFAIADTRGGTVRVSKNSGGDGIVWTDKSAGKFDIFVRGDDTTDLLGTYWMEVEVEDGDGDKSTVLAGHIEFERSTV